MSAISHVGPTSGRTATKRWTYAEFERLGELGFLRGHRYELIEGKIVRMAPQKDVHTAAVSKARRAIERAVGDGFWVRMQFPLQIGRWSGPEPDVSIVPGQEDDYVGTGHPKTALLVVEVSDTTLRSDRRRKVPLYAKAGVPEYWIVNLIDREVEVRRAPGVDPANPKRQGYADVTVVSAAGSIPIYFVPGAAVAVGDLLPRNPSA